MRKLFLSGVSGDEIIITGDEHKHLAYSLRARRGDELTVCSDGYDYLAVITDINKSETRAKIVGRARVTTEPETKITLYFGAMKGDKNDYVVQKCTELGVVKFVPFISDFCSVKAESVKAERLNRIALEASKQSGRGLVPTVESTRIFDQLLEELKEYELVVFPYEQEQQTSIGEFLKTKNAKNIAVVVGSEGGFSPLEADKIRAISGESVTLGERILRADTASVAVVSVVLYESGEWKRK